MNAPNWLNASIHTLSVMPSRWSSLAGLCHATSYRSPPRRPRPAMLSTVMQPLFAQHLVQTLRDGIRPLPAVLFYFIYMAGVVWFAGWPALREGTPVTALVHGAVLSFVAYGTYELTS